MDLSRINTEPGLFAEVAARLSEIVTSTVAEEVSERKSILNQIGQNWKPSQIYYALSLLDTSVLITLCQRHEMTRRNVSNYNEYGWQAAMNAKALTGVAEDITAIREAARIDGYNVNMNTALGYACKKYTPASGITLDVNLETTEALLKNGASANDEDGATYAAAVASGGMAIGRVFARNGLSKTYMHNQMRNAINQGRPSAELREIYWEYARYTVPDAQTLVETKALDDANTSQMRIVFNFAAGRVSEMIEWLGNKAAYVPVVRDFSFDEYGAAAIEQAREKLTELGGHPVDSPRSISKKRSPLQPKD